MGTYVELWTQTIPAERKRRTGQGEEECGWSVEKRRGLAYWLGENGEETGISGRVRGTAALSFEDFIPFFSPQPWGCQYNWRGILVGKSPTLQPPGGELESRVLALGE